MILAILLIVVLQASAFDDEMKAMLRALGRMQGCATPTLAAQWKDGGLMEVTVTCVKPGEGSP